jgi:hypothetical protein
VGDNGVRYSIVAGGCTAVGMGPLCSGQVISLMPEVTSFDAAGRDLVNLAGVFDDEDVFSAADLV